MPIRAKLGNSYQPGTVLVKQFDTYLMGHVYLKHQGAYRDASTEGPGPGTTPSLDFSDPDNSMYLALVSVGGM